LFDGRFKAPLVATSRPVANLKGLPGLLGVPVVHRWESNNLESYDGVIAWGRKPSAKVASNFADRHSLSLIQLEDGFLRSVGLGSQEPPLSIVVDDLGIYYDATTASRLEVLISTGHTDAQSHRARALISAWRSAYISKYNHARNYEGVLPERYVLVADQTMGDASIHFGLAESATFQDMLTAALKENPECTVLLKTHPDVLAGKKRGYFILGEITKNPRVMLLADDVHPVSLIENAEVIYAATSQIGFEGLLWGKRVRTFGMPFYAGWGLTEDAMTAPSRRKPVQLEDLVHAALVDYSRYIDPETGKSCEPERLIEWMGLQRYMRNRFPAIVYAQGFSLYKRPVVRRFFQGSQVHFVRKLSDVPENGMVALWGRQPFDKGIDKARVVRLEDGFIRSVGLGADLVRPLSWVMDRQGIYYDATVPSDLENILQNTNFDSALTERAKIIRQRLIKDGLTKYNVGVHVWQPPGNIYFGADNFEEVPRKIILVPGQVESDASLEYGAPEIVGNIELLRVVREQNPDAYVIYKPHPDVVAGLRSTGVGEGAASLFCDEVLQDADMGEMLQLVDEVHTLTSLAGFEALLRGKRVVCYGQPFYAGWGLTEDRLPIPRRTRSLLLDELVAAVLILYPVYISRISGRFTTPERILDELLTWREGSSAQLPWWGLIYRLVVKWILRKR